MNFPLTSSDPLTKSIREAGIMDWLSLTRYIRNLKYGRNSNRENLTLVWTEKKGTCSSKHAFLAKIASLNNQNGIKLIMVIYNMKSTNTDHIKPILDHYKLEYIPEAHCVLFYDQAYHDFTHANSSYDRILSDVCYTEEIEPEQVSMYKVDLHQKYIKEWIAQNELADSFDALWKIREECIEALGY